MTYKDPEIDHSEALRYLKLDPDTGHIYRRDYKLQVRPDFIGKRIGYPASKGYRDVRIRPLTGGRSVREHRMVWFLHYGRWPDGQIDHIDNDKTNNAIHNLREMNTEDNCRRIEGHDSESKGVTRDPTRRGKQWEALVSLHGKWFRVGLYETKETALVARAAAVRVKNQLLGPGK